MKIYIDQNIPEIKIAYTQSIELSNQVRISSSLSAAVLLHDIWDKNLIEAHEEFKIVLLNSKNVVKGVFTASKGGIAGTVVDVRIILAVALKTLSVGIILAHNHPSGSLIPSDADKGITKKIKEAARFMDIKVLDHIIITPYGQHFSFSDEGIL